MKDKNIGLPGERSLSAQGAWFYAIASIFLFVPAWHYPMTDPMVAFAAVIGSTAFFITHGFRQNAEAQAARLKESGVPAISKLLYLEAIDTTLSIDGVIGAFVVRWITVSNVERIKHYPLLKNGARAALRAGRLPAFQGRDPLPELALDGSERRDLLTINRELGHV